MAMNTGVNTRWTGAQTCCGQAAGLQPLQPVETKEPDGEAVEISVHPAERSQRILGFGGAFTESAAWVWHQLSPEQRTRVLEAYFDPEGGAGYTVGRTHINSCDFSLGNYAGVSVPGDVTAASFSLEREEQWLLPFLRAAQQAAGGPLRLLASPWSPPAWMKTNGRMNGGGSLKPEYRAAWARAIVCYLDAMRGQGFDVRWITVQNEPRAAQTWDSCLYSHAEQRDFVREYLGPALCVAGLGQDVRILVWDHNKDELEACAEVILSDPSTARYVWGIGFHWYEGDHFDQLDRVREAFPETVLLATEACQEGGPHVGSWDVAERYAHAVIGDLNHGAAGWIDWNLLLDMRGGPNHVGNFCSAPVLADPAEDAVVLQPSYYALAHFSRYIRPGAVRVGVRAADPLEVVAAENEDGTLAVVLFNPGDREIRYRLDAGDSPLHGTLPAHAIASLLRRPGDGDPGSAAMGGG